MNTFIALGVQNGKSDWLSKRSVEMGRVSLRESNACQPKGERFESHLASQIHRLRVVSAFWLTVGEPAPPEMANTCEKGLSLLAGTAGLFAGHASLTRHLRSTVREFVTYYNRGRPHASLGPGIPEPIQASAPDAVHRHKLPVGYRISSKSILGGLHHDYRLEEEAAYRSSRRARGAQWDAPESPRFT